MLQLCYILAILLHLRLKTYKIKSERGDFMKRLFLLIMVLALLLSVCGCKRALPDDELIFDAADTGKTEQKEESSAENAAPDTAVENQAQTNELQNQESVLYEGDEPQVVGPELSEFLETARAIDVVGSIREFPQTFEEFSARLEKINGSIIAGRAFGTRRKDPAILTEFSVEKVYAGPDVPDRITVEEGLGIYTDPSGQPYLMSFGYEEFPLINDQPTLLFVFPHSTKKDLYVATLLTLPLPDDHQKYDEEYLTELLDYFRGDRSAYKYSKLTITETIIDGNPVPTGYGGVYWPKQEISDEALLEQMNDHILLRLATDYKIKIWPFDHAQYSAERTPSDYFLKMSYPPTYKP